MIWSLLVPAMALRWGMIGFITVGELPLLGESFVTLLVVATIGQSKIRACRRVALSRLLTVCMVGRWGGTK